MGARAAGAVSLAGAAQQETVASAVGAVLATAAMLAAVIVEEGQDRS